ncbi:MAG TPA: DUF3828 domain-containing protein [Patescibacteria group bacterium]|nr:DUF3828 domain-containing protein [Patescibacteria group bacterium]
MIKQIIQKTTQMFPKIKRLFGRDKKFYILLSMFSLAAILFIAAVVIAIAGMASTKNNTKKANQEAAMLQDKKMTVEVAVNSFYNWYIHGNTDVFSDVSYKDRGTLTPDLIAKIEKNVAEQKESDKKIDPVICGVGMPDTVAFGDITVKNDAATVEMNLNYIKSRKIKLELILQDNQWKINEIICP